MTNNGAEVPAVLVVTGMAREMRLAAGPGSIVIKSGGDPVRLRQLLDARRGPRCRLVLSFGIAGGLDPLLRPGDVIVSAGVVDRNRHWPAHAALAGSLAQRLESGGFKPFSADIAGSDRPVVSAGEKQAMRATTRAAAVDMESHVAAAYATAQGLPFAAVRVVCDPAGSGLPRLVAGALRPDGRVDLPAILRSLARRPAQLPDLVRLAGEARASFRSLGRCGDLLGIGRGGPDLVELLRDIP